MAALTAYQALLLDFTPRPIRTDRQYRRVMDRIARLMRQPRLTRPESQILELLATLAEQYESLEHPTPEASQEGLLAHLLDVHGVTRTEVSRGPGVHIAPCPRRDAGRCVWARADGPPPVGSRPGGDRRSDDRHHHRPVPASRRRGVPSGATRRRPSPAGSRPSLRHVSRGRDRHRPVPTSRR